LAIAAIPGRPRFARHLAAARTGAARAARRLVRPHRAALANLAGIPLTVAAVPLIDFAAFHLGHGWGFLITGMSLIAVEHLIADED
jgi:hypothetical protein